MILFAEAQEVSVSATLIGLGIIVGFFGIWSLVFARLSSGMPVLPVRARRRVPWTGIDVLVIVVFWLALEIMVGRAIISSLQDTFPPPADAAELSENPIAILFKGGSLWMIAVAVVSAAVIAPLFEEFLFRVLIQGWLESVVGKSLRFAPTVGRWLFAGPVIAVAILFSLIHFRGPTEEMNPNLLAFAMLGMISVRVVVLFFAVALLIVGRNAKPRDFGWPSKSFLKDAGLGVLAYIAIAAPTYVILSALTRYLPDFPLNDPIALFPLALMMGLVYYRTHRVVPVLALHATFNSVALIGASLGG